MERRMRVRRIYNQLLKDNEVYHGLTTSEQKEARTANSTYKKLAVQCSADTFVVNQTLVLRISICGKNRQLLLAPNRYQKGYEDRKPTTTLIKIKQYA